MRCRFLFVLLILCCLVACAQRVTVGEIQKAPDAFRGKTVSVRGKVQGATKLPFMQDGFYRLDDGTGSIVVVTRGELPEEGKATTARGRVESAFQIGGRTFGLVLVPEK
jgi:hypothetical protein